MLCPSRSQTGGSFGPQNTLQQIVIRTNQFTRQSSLQLKPRLANHRHARWVFQIQIQQWRDLTVLEQAVWPALVFTFGVHCLPQAVDYWKSNRLFETPNSHLFSLFFLVVAQKHPAVYTRHISHIPQLPPKASCFLRFLNLTGYLQVAFDKQNQHDTLKKASFGCQNL